MTTKKRLAIMLLAFVLGISAVITAAQVPVIAKAESTVTYTNVLEDLQRDSSFSKENYPEKVTDYSLQIIQLAESSDKELFVYVYQPNGQLKGLVASSINISTTINDAVSYHNYKLELLNADGVFFKYKVSDFVVKDDAVRYYAITSVYRKWDKTIDPATGNDNTVTEVNYNVSKQYAFGTINGKPYVNCVDIDTIVVTDKFVGFVRYENGFTLYNSACDSHFVAFNTDKPIDKLLEADVYYTTQSYNWNWTAFVGEKETFGTKQDNYSYLKYTDKVEHTGEGWFAGTYKWDRIQTVDDFISGENRENIFHGAVLDVKVSTKLTDSAIRDCKKNESIIDCSNKCFLSRYFDADFASVVGLAKTNALVTIFAKYLMGKTDNFQCNTIIELIRRIAVISAIKITTFTGASYFTLRSHCRNLYIKHKNIKGDIL